MSIWKRLGSLFRRQAPQARPENRGFEEHPLSIAYQRIIDEERAAIGDDSEWDPDRLKSGFGWVALAKNFRLAGADSSSYAAEILTSLRAMERLCCGASSDHKTPERALFQRVRERFKAHLADQGIDTVLGSPDEDDVEVAPIESAG
jgi:hypothetical protein